MADFSSSDAYLEALNSEQIVLVVGEKAERMSVAKGLYTCWPHGLFVDDKSFGTPCKPSTILTIKFDAESDT